MKYSICFLFFTLFSLYRCTGINSQVVTATDSTNIITIERFDKDLMSFLRETSSEKETDLRDKYKGFLGAFGSVAVDNSDYENPLYFPSLLKYFSNGTLIQIYKDAVDTFNVIEPYELELSNANELINKNFEGKKLPTLSMHISGFKANTIVLEDRISISSDKYIGQDYPLYKDFFEDYQRIQMQPKMIVRDYLKAWLIGEIPMDNKRKDLLSEMIHEGKLLYALQQLLPDWSEADLIGYTQKQVDWATKNKKSVWKETIKQNYLYSPEYMIISKYLEEAPSTSIVSVDSPGRLGAWIGWNIVKDYAKNTNLSLYEILKETDSQNILKVSKYNP